MNEKYTLPARMETDITVEEKRGWVRISQSATGENVVLNFGDLPQIAAWLMEIHRALQEPRVVSVQREG